MPDEATDQPENQPTIETHLSSLQPPPEQGPVVVSDGPDESDDGSPLPYPVVAIGASAGGLEAYIALFGSLPIDTNMAFVVISHLSPEHKSHLVEILGRTTHMPVSDIREGIRPEPDHVYVLPPGIHTRLERGVFRVEHRPVDAISRPIDYFFRSLAADQKSRALGVVLSGSDADGALGLKAIKGEGGITLVQSPESAQFPDMPRSSISADHVDRILPPELIAKELGQLAQQYREPTVEVQGGAAPEPGEAQHFARILALLQSVSGVDFRLYKPNTVRRRVARRMMLNGLRTAAEYAAFLQGNAKELRDLEEDTLIGVTRFFRDPPVFDALKQVILPKILEGRLPDHPVRIWVAGCSTGEEAYSIGICLMEFLTGQPVEPPIQIFGTDASEYNIQTARAGIFPESVVSEVSPERLHRFFVKVDKGYQVHKRVRDLCIFARQNLCYDPPFSKMDLISCRNVLIYFGADLQKQVLPTFHYGLRQDGYLLLGVTETIREFTDLFQMVDRQHKFFVKTGNGVTRVMMNVPVYHDLMPVPVQNSSTVTETWGDLELQRAADRLVLARYGPPGAVINARLELLQSRGHTGPFLEMPQGPASLQFNRMLRDSIAAPVNEAVRRAIEQDSPVRVEGLRLLEGEEVHGITVEVLPIRTAAPRSRSFLVIFLPAPEPGPARAGGQREEAPVTPADNAMERIRHDLASTKAYLQTLLEERDTRNQELVCANEEIQSSNEELQSTNEELETTKEELQSSNEELQTVNDELQQRNAVLLQATNDLSNLLNSVSLPVLMLSNELHIRHFTPPMERLMNLRASDIGRPVGDIRLNLSVDDLQPLFRQVLETLAPREVEVQDRQGHWHLLRVRPYRTSENRIEGIVIVLLDVDQLRKSEQELRASRDFSQSVIENMALPLAVVSLELRIRAVNDAFRALAGVGAEPLDGRSLLELSSLAWGLDQPLRSHLEGLRKSAAVGDNFEFEFIVAGESPKVFIIRGRTLKPDGEVFLLVTIEDVTAQLKLAKLLESEREQLARRVESAARELRRTQEDLRALANSLFTSQEDERRRVARELHDDICQKLAALEIDTQQVSRRMKEAPEQASSELENVRVSIAALSDEVRRISHSLHPSVIDDLGLVPALRSLVEDVREREGMIATFSAQKIPENIPAQVATGLYRIAQEALRNVGKHAGKTHVKVILRGLESAIRLQVIDSGEGFDTQARRSGLGLISMEERARMVQGEFTVESELGEGTKVTIQVPLPENRGPE